MSQLKAAKEVLAIAKAIQADVDQILRPQMTEQDIERIIAACGYVCTFDDRVRHGDGKCCRYVKARTRGPAKNRVNRSLGRIEKVEVLSQDELVQLIEAKFAEKKEMKNGK